MSFEELHKEAAMTTLTAELRQEIEKAGDEPVRIDDPETQTTYVLIRADVYDQIKPSPGREDLPE